jgi:hypothetical protein
MEMETTVTGFSQKKRGMLLARRLRAVAIVVVLGSIVVVGGRLSLGHDAAVRPADAGTAPTAVATDGDYFPSHFPEPKGEPAQPVEQF